MGLLAEQRAQRRRGGRRGLTDSQQAQGIFNTVKRIFDPIGSPAARTAEPERRRRWWTTRGRHSTVRSARRRG